MSGKLTSCMKEALLLIDIQNDYFPGGKMELVSMEEAAKKAGELLKAFRTAGKNLFSLSSICLQDQTPHSLYPELREWIFIRA